MPADLGRAAGDDDTPTAPDDDDNDVEMASLKPMTPTAAITKAAAAAATRQPLLLTAFLSLGVVFGDIGTSPLYTFSSIFKTAPPSPAHVIGALSLCVWTLLTVVVFKYLVFVLLASDHGEGGIFALYGLVSKGLRTYRPDHPRMDEALALLALVGLSAMCSEGIITPAISVLSAIEGLSVISPAFTPLVVPLSVVLLVLFFSAQGLGTKRISFLFSPITSLWFLTLFCVGVYNTAKNPSVLAAWNPAHAWRFVANEGGLPAMGSVFLTVTGAEALYSDLGHFSAGAIRLSALSVVLPALVACYCGQAAALVDNPWMHGNVFFLSLPPPLLRPMVLLSTLAAIIASQAMVSGSFSLLSMAVRRDALPPLTVVRTNAHALGQVFMPGVNRVYMALCVAIVLAFGSSAALGDAYGVAVSTLFCITTALYSLAVVVHFRRPAWLALAFLLGFGSFDAAFLLANLSKLGDGGWITVTLASALLACALAWRWGRAAVAHASSPPGAAAPTGDASAVLPRTLVVVDDDTRGLDALTAQLGVRPQRVVRVRLDVIADAAHVESWERAGEDAAVHTRGALDAAPDVAAAVRKLFPGAEPAVVVTRERVVASPGASLARRAWVRLFAAMVDATASEAASAGGLQVVVTVVV